MAWIRDALGVTEELKNTVEAQKKIHNDALAAAQKKYKDDMRRVEAEFREKNNELREDFKTMREDQASQNSQLAALEKQRTEDMKQITQQFKVFSESLNGATETFKILSETQQKLATNQDAHLLAIIAINNQLSGKGTADPPSDESTPIAQFLTATGLKQHIPLCAAQEIELDELMEMTHEELKAIKLPYGACTKMLKFTKNPEVSKLLIKKGLADYIPKFVAKNIDMKALLEMTYADLTSLGMSHEESMIMVNAIKDTLRAMYTKQ